MAFCVILSAYLQGCDKREESSTVPPPPNQAAVVAVAIKQNITERTIAFCKTLDTVDPESTEEMIIGYLDHMVNPAFEDILEFRSQLTKAQLNGNVQVEFLVRLTQLDPKRTFELAYTEKNDPITTVRTWMGMVKPEEYGALLEYILQDKFSPSQVSGSVNSLGLEFAQENPVGFVQKLNELAANPHYNNLVNDNARILTFHSPSDALDLIRKISDPVIKLDAMVNYGAGMYRRSLQEKWQGEISGMKDIPEPELRSAAYAGVYLRMLEKDFDSTIKLVENLQDQSAYDRIISENPKLLDKHLKRDEVFALIYKVKDPAAVKKLEKFTGMDLSQTNKIQSP